MTGDIYRKLNFEMMNSENSMRNCMGTSRCLIRKTTWMMMMHMMRWSLRKIGSECWMMIERWAMVQKTMIRNQPNLKDDAVFQDTGPPEAATRGVPRRIILESDRNYVEIRLKSFCEQVAIALKLA